MRSQKTHLKGTLLGESRPSTDRPYKDIKKLRDGSPSYHQNEGRQQCKRLGLQSTQLTHSIWRNIPQKMSEQQSISARSTTVSTGQEQQPEGSHRTDNASVATQGSQPVSSS